LNRRLPLAAAAGAAAANLFAAAVLFAGDHPSPADAQMASLNPEIAGRIARTQFALAFSDPSKTQAMCADPRYRRLARSSVAIEPLMGDALAAAVLAQRCRGDQAYLAAAKATEPLNRRDLTLEGLQLDEQLRSGRADAVMATMRRMIVLYPDLSDRLVPMLARVATDDAALARVVSLVKQQPDWKRSFLQYASENFQPQQILEVRRQYGGVDADVASIDKDVVGTLTKRGDLASAWDYFRLAAPGEARKRDLELLGTNGDYQPFGWAPSDSHELQARLGTGSDDVLEATLHLRAAGTLAVQAFPAVNGSYRVDFDAKADPDVTLGVLVRCLAPATGDWLPLAKGQTINPSTLGGACRFGLVRIDAASSGAGDRHDVVVRKLTLTKVS
jgi:hypothetical protein